MAFVKLSGNKEIVATFDVSGTPQIKVLSYREKDEWLLETKYNIGKKREE